MITSPFAKTSLWLVWLLFLAGCSSLSQKKGYGVQPRERVFRDDPGIRCERHAGSCFHKDRDEEGVDLLRYCGGRRSFTSLRRNAKGNQSREDRPTKWRPAA